MTHRRSLPLVALVLVALGPAAARAQAPAEAAGEIERANEFAVENIDLGDYEAAKAKLVEALALLEASGQQGQPLAARTHMLLGLVYAQGLADPARGNKHFVRAHELDGKIALDRHASEETRALWAKAGKAVNPTVDCDSLEGIAHRRVIAADAGKPIAIAARLEKALFTGPAELRYKSGAMTAFASVAMDRASDCEIAATIPAAAVTAPSLHYYVVVKTAAGKTAAASGSERKPNLVDVTSTAPSPEARAAVRRQEEEVPEELQVGRGKGGSCAGCAGGAGGASAPGLVGLALAALLVRRRRG